MQLVEDNHYIICLDFKFHQLYIIWIGDDVDTVLTNDDLKIIAFKNEDDLSKYWLKYIKGSNTEIATYNAHMLQQWFVDPHTIFDHDEFLNFWNLFTDISESTKIKFVGNEKDEIRNAIYHKLFNASDVFIADEPNPVFSNIEFEMLIKVMKNGLDLLLNNLTIVETE